MEFPFTFTKKEKGLIQRLRLIVPKVLIAKYAELRDYFNLSDYRLNYLINRVLETLPLSLRRYAPFTRKGRVECVENKDGGVGEVWE